MTVLTSLATVVGVIVGLISIYEKRKILKEILKSSVFLFLLQITICAMTDFLFKDRLDFLVLCAMAYFVVLFIDFLITKSFEKIDMSIVLIQSLIMIIIFSKSISVRAVNLHEKKYHVETNRVQGNHVDKPTR
jgi:Ca2+/Na+ antiporter